MKSGDAMFMKATQPASATGVTLLVLLLLLAAGCGDGGMVVIGTGTASGAAHSLRPGIYTYRAWSDHSRGGPVWSGYLDLRTEAGDRLTGHYHLPWHCSDAYGFTVDCVGWVGGRIERDGAVRFGLDEGWLVHEGWIGRDGRITGRWESRILGYRDTGTFELVPGRR